MGCAASKPVEPTQPGPGPNQRPKTEAGAGAQATAEAQATAKATAVGGSAEGQDAPPSVQLRLDVEHGLEAHDLTDLWREKHGAHLPGTREWAFKEVFAWLDAAPSDAAQLFWLMGGGGVGKSVLTAELLRRAYGSNRVVAWHFCRHDNPQQSSPDALLRSLAAMLCARLPGYKEALGEVASELLKSTDPKELFAALFAAPLQKVKSPAKPSFIILDALDELPKQGQKPLLSVIAAQLSTLPPWLRLFVTSREEPQIKAALAKFEPKELRADEAKNRADVEVYLRSIARTHVQGEVNAADIEKDVQRKFRIDLTGKLAELQEPMDKSRAIYGKAVAALEGTNGYEKVLAIPDDRPEVRQASNDFNLVYAQAEAARDLLRNALADEWFVDEERKQLGKTDFYYPVPAQKRAWVDQAIDPGIKGEPRSREKMKNDYSGDANMLKDLARITLKYESCDRMATAIKELKKAGFALVVSKNKYLSPTPMGYCDLNFIVELKLKDDTPYLAEVQVNHVAMLEAKSEAHTHYEVVRERLPQLCTGSTVDPGELEAFIVGRLNSSALDAAVAALSAKADGLFLYAHLLAQHLDTEAKAGRTIDFAGLHALPAGLDEVYAENFKRAFPEGAADAAWRAARPLIELIAAAMEPIAQAMAAALLGWNAAQQKRVLEATALLFPVRDGKFHVFHKTVVDWLTGEITADSSLKSRSKVFHVERQNGHAEFGKGFVAWLGGPRSGAASLTDDGKCDDAVAAYWLQHGIVHMCRAQGTAARAVEVYATDLAFLRQRLDAGHLAAVAKDYVELCRVQRPSSTSGGAPLNLGPAAEMKAFVGKHRGVLQSARGGAVSQLASQEPDNSSVHRAWTAGRAGRALPPGRLLGWRNKPQQRDPCVAALAHPESVAALAVSRTRIVAGAGEAVFVYDAGTEELLEELECTAKVSSVAVFEDETGAGWIAAGCEDGTIKVWDAGRLTPPAPHRPHPFGLVRVAGKKPGASASRVAHGRSDGTTGTTGDRKLRAEARCWYLGIKNGR